MSERTSTKDLEDEILSQISVERCTQSTVIATYALLLDRIRDGEAIDWRRINRAICTRWEGDSALGRIKTKAWKLLWAAEKKVLL